MKTNKEWYKNYYQNNKEAILKKSREWYLKNKKRKLQKKKEWLKKRYHSDSEFRKKLLELAKAYRNKTKYESSSKSKERKKLWRETNREKCREMCRSHYTRNKNYYIAKVAKRRAAKLKRTPKWANLQAIQAIYDNCPPGYHVDHIIPLQGHNVSGLHVEYNLQYLPANENKAKGNRMP